MSALFRFVLPRPLVVAAVAFTLLAGTARAQDLMPLVRADRWADADAVAAQYTDPVVRKLVTWMRLMAPGASTVDELTRFMADSPDWPLQSTLARRREEALAAEPDDAAAARACDAIHPKVLAALLRCADALAKQGRTADATAFARRAWVAAPADLAWETRFLGRWTNVLTGAQEWARFERLLASDPGGAARQSLRLDPADRPRAEARLALRRDDPRAAALVAALPAAQQAEPMMVLDRARWLRRAGQDDDALALWKSLGTPAEHAAPADERAAFWNERNLLARRRLRQNDAAGAYALAAGHAQTGEQVADAEFLAGFIALRLLHDPATAARHFHALTTSRSAITLGRAHYWLGRSDPATASAEYAAAAAFPNTYYGQLAALARGESPAALAARITAARDAPADAQQALDLAGRELARAAAYLVSWGEPRRALPFLLRLDDVSPDAADRVLAARLSTGFGMPQAAVAIARRAGSTGLILLQTGWPLAADVPPDAGLDPALALGIIRQESSFDPVILSPAGARGLMQLMPATATSVGRTLGMTVSLPMLTNDPHTNVLLGTTYLRQLMDQFGNAVPLAVAAYNAGPSRVRDWLDANGDPRVEGAPVDMIDWIELIPFSETRNYVQRVIENMVIYRAKRGEAGPHPLAQWLK